MFFCKVWSIQANGGVVNSNPGVFRRILAGNCGVKLILRQRMSRLDYTSIWLPESFRAVLVNNPHPTPPHPLSVSLAHSHTADGCRLSILTHIRTYAWLNMLFPIHISKFHCLWRSQQDIDDISTTLVSIRNLCEWLLYLTNFNEMYRRI